MTEYKTYEDIISENDNLMKLLSNKNITFDNDRVKKVSEYLK
jgi:hypothetical protein